MRNGRRRRSGAADKARPDAEAGATGGGLLGWVRKHPLKIIGAALVTTLTAWLGVFFGSATGDIFPSGADAFCTLSETVRASWPFAEKPAASDKFTILIATIDGDDANRTYTYAVGRAFVDRKGIEQTDTCRVLRVAGFGHEASAKTVAAAQHWLQQRHADLLIGGRLLKKERFGRSRFIGNGGGQGVEPKKFSLDANLLKEDFAKAASDQLLAVALAAVNPATEQQGKYLVEILRPVTNRLRNLLRDPAGFAGNSVRN